MAVDRVPRRANLATIVGSSLAVVAAASLIAFSSLAEQAGLDGLATGRLEPTKPGRAEDVAHPITVPAPATAPPGDPRDELAERVRAVAGRDRERAFVPADVAGPAPAPPREKAPPQRAPRVAETPRVAVTGPEVDHEAEVAEPDGPPYGHAYGHYKKKHKAPKPAKGKKHSPKSRSAEQPVYARSANDGTASRPPKAPKMKKVQKVKPAGHPGNGKAKGHAKHAHKGKAKGHAKHAHKGKGKGHSKHGG